MSAVDDTSADTQHQPPSAATNATTHDTTTTSSSSSIFVPDDAPVYDMPVSAINRPLQSVVDADKVQRFVADMQAGSVFTPIEVVHVQGDVVCWRCWGGLEGQTVACVHGTARGGREKTVRVAVRGEA